MKNVSAGVRWLPVIAAVVVAAALRFWGIEAKSVWGDEVVTLTVSMGHSWYPWHGEETALSYDASYYRERVALQPKYFSQRLGALLRINDQMPPLYYVLLNLWLHAFGVSARALRSLSLLAGVASIPIAYLVGRTLSTHRVGAYAAWIFALAPFQVAFALYNRPYALLGFFALLSTLAAVHLARGSRGKWLVVYPISIALGVYTHYLFVWNIAFQLILVTYCQRRDRRFLARFGFACLAAAIACSFWIPTFLAQVQWSSQLEHQSWFYWYSGQASLTGVFGSLRRSVFLLLSPGFVGGLCEAGAGGECRLDDVLRVPVYGMPALIAALCGWRFLQHVRRASVGLGHQPDPWWTCVLWAGCAFLGPVLMDLVLDSHLASSHRYFISASGPVYLVIALAVAGTGRRGVRWTMSAAYLLFLFAGSILYLRGSTDGLMPEMGARDVAAHIDSQRTDGRDLILVLDPGPNPMDFSYYLRSNPAFARVKVPERHRSAPHIAAQLRAVTAARQPFTIWYLDDHGPERRAHEAVLEWLRSHYVETATRGFMGMGVIAFRPRSESR